MTKGKKIIIQREVSDRSITSPIIAVLLVLGLGFIAFILTTYLGAEPNFKFVFKVSLILGVIVGILYYFSDDDKKIIEEEVWIKK